MAISEVMITAISVGVLGGTVRALYGLLKAAGKGLHIHKGYFIATLIISAFIGGLMGTVFDSDYRIAALAGYVGTDLLENIFKGSIGKSLMVKAK
jgi:hypothetical protein